MTAMKTRTPVRPVTRKAPVRKVAVKKPAVKKVAVKAKPKETYDFYLNGLIFNDIGRTLTDIEASRVALVNRLEVMTRKNNVPDTDGICRGHGIPQDHESVVFLKNALATIENIEKSTIGDLEFRIKHNPLYAWGKGVRGLGEKTFARVLAEVGDPCWHTSQGRIRSVSEFWSYCGYGDAALQHRQKGVQGNWNPEARKRIYVIADQFKKQVDPGCKPKTVSETWKPLRHKKNCACSIYRIIYDDYRRPRMNNGLTAKHQDMQALRKVAKELLKDMYNEAKRLREEGLII